jgi:hypothetical protein
MSSVSALQTVSVNIPTSKVPKSNCTSESQSDKLPSSPTDAIEPSALAEDDRQFTKDALAFEYSRQRLRNVRARARKRAIKERGSSRAVPAVSFPSEKERRLWADDLDPLRDIKVPKADRAGLSSLQNVVPTRELTVWDAMTAGKPRKAKGTCTSNQPFACNLSPSGPEGDYEMIPRIRSVITLDDSNVVDLDMDEPWEHIDQEDKQDLEFIQKPSYAEVLSLTQ